MAPKASKTISFAKATSPVVVRRLERFGTTSNYDRFKVTDEMKEAAEDNGISAKEMKAFEGTVYLGKGSVSTDEVYVIVTTEPPKGFVDPFGDAHEDDD